MQDKEWCTETRIIVPKTSKQSPKKFRCPKCKKNFATVRRFMCSANFGPLVYIPRHKKKKKSSPKSV